MSVRGFIVQTWCNGDSIIRVDSVNDGYVITNGSTMHNEDLGSKLIRNLIQLQYVRDTTSATHILYIISNVP